MTRYADILVPCVVFATIAATRAMAAPPEGAATPATAQVQCADRSLPGNTRLAACTSVIESRAHNNLVLAAAYLGRCEVLHSRSIGIGMGGKTSPADDEHALQDCNRAIQLKPDNDRAYDERALVYTDLKDYPRTIADYDRAIQLNPNWFTAFAFRGMAYSALGQYDRAIADCTHALPHDLGGFARKCVKDAEASKARIAAGQKPGDLRAWCDGKALEEEGGGEARVVEGCTRLIDSNKETPADLVKDYFNRAEANEFGSDADKAEAISDFETVIRLKPDYADAYGWLGSMFWVQSQYEKAIPYLSRAITLNGSRADIYLEYRGLSYSGLGQFAQAIKDFDSLIKKDPSGFQVAQYSVDRSFAFNGAGNYDRAITDADQAIKLSHTSEATEGYDSRAEARFHKGDLDGAIIDYDSSLKLYPEYARALYGRGVARLKKGDRAGGQADIDAARKLDGKVPVEEARYGITP